MSRAPWYTQVDCRPLWSPSAVDGDPTWRVYHFDGTFACKVVAPDAADAVAAAAMADYVHGWEQSGEFALREVRS